MTTDVGAFIDYWESEGSAYRDHGDYAWMASLVPGGRVLEIGCGLGFGTEALLARGIEVLALDMLPACLERASARTAACGDQVRFLQADLSHLTEEETRVIHDFSADSVVCWLMGAPRDMTHQDDKAASQAVALYRQEMHRKLAHVAAALPTVQAVHLVDRTVIPWQAKDLGRDTLVRYHLLNTFSDLPFGAVRQNALYRRLEESGDLAQVRRSHPSLKSVVPTLASLLAHRHRTVQE